MITMANPSFQISLKNRAFLQTPQNCGLGRLLLKIHIWIKAWMNDGTQLNGWGFITDASTQWCSSGDPGLICIIGTHWNTTGRPLEAHGKHTGYQQFFSPVAFQCTLGSKFQAHWIAYRLPLDYHWLMVRVATLRWLSTYVASSIDQDIMGVSVRQKSKG